MSQRVKMRAAPNPFDCVERCALETFFDWAARTFRFPIHLFNGKDILTSLRLTFPCRMYHAFCEMGDIRGYCPSKCSLNWDPKCTLSVRLFAAREIILGTIENQAFPYRITLLLRKISHKTFIDTRLENSLFSFEIFPGSVLCF
jgi:hypothetical protein